MGRSAGGVRGINLKRGNEVIGMEVITDPKDQLIIVTENGFGKRTRLTQYRRQNRGGSGILTAKVTKRTGEVIDARIVKPGFHDILLISAQGKVIRAPLRSISVLGRATQGVTLMRLDKGDKVTSLAIFEKEEEEKEKTPQEKEEPKEEKAPKKAKPKPAPKKAKAKKTKPKPKPKGKKKSPKRRSPTKK